MFCARMTFFWNPNRQATFELQSWSFNPCMLALTNDTDHPLVDRFSAFIQSPAFPCLGAKAALSRGFLHTVVARDITSAWDDLPIYSGLFNLSHSYRRNPRLFQSFAVLFEGPSRLSERQFEEALWARVQSLTEKDAFHGQPYDRRVSSNPENPHFSLSFGSEAFFIVGLHPRASRASRRFESPVLVFNLHDQFEQLRDVGKYEKLRSAIIERDVTSSGSANPMLAKHGESSEARQYSGRIVADDWRCPFKPGRRALYE